MVASYTYSFVHLIPSKKCVLFINYNFAWTDQRVQQVHTYIIQLKFILYLPPGVHSTECPEGDKHVNTIFTLNICMHMFTHTHMHSVHIRAYVSACAYTHTTGKSICKVTDAGIIS